MKLSKNLQSLSRQRQRQQRKRKRLAVDTFLPVYILLLLQHTIRPGATQANLHSRSPKSTSCTINSSWKATPFSKLWGLVIRSEEVTKIIAPNRCDSVARERAKYNEKCLNLWLAAKFSPRRFISLSRKKRSKTSSCINTFVERQRKRVYCVLIFFGKAHGHYSQKGITFA